MQRRQASKQRFVTELSQCLFDFVIQLLPTQEEMAVKEDVRKLLERLIRTIEPDSRLLSFGSTANGFSLRNSDMDLCCLIDSEERLSATDLVTMLGDLLERETKFHVKPLPHARIPIVKLSLDPSPGLPLGIACDIGFENRLALENTRLLMCYAMIDPTRVRTMVLFLKVWSKRRKINSPYKGTLSSYGYVLLVIYFLVHVKNPPVLPNLQQMPPLRPISKEDTHLNGHNIWFFDDIDLLRQRWHSENLETVAELLIDFFRYYSRDFAYNTGVASIRAGLLKKDSKGWLGESSGRYGDARERNRLCIEDPFETDYNVARCVTKDGLYTIRGEFMRAARILATRPERAIVALAELCEERKDEELVPAPPYHRPAPIPPQTPYTVGNQSLRPKNAERFSPPAQFFEPGLRQVVQPATIRPPPDHMAPKRGKWTSPPPPEAPSADHTQFENQLGMVLQLATAATAAREKETSYNSSESNSEIFTDDGSDLADEDIKSVRSYTEQSSPVVPGVTRRPSWHTHDTARPQSVFNPLSSGSGTSSRSSSSARGRFPRLSDRIDLPAGYRPPPEFIPSSARSEFNRRSTSGPPRSLKTQSLSSNTPFAIATPLPPSPQSQSQSPIDPRLVNEPPSVYYQTATTRSPQPTAIYPNSGTQSSFLSQYQQPQPQAGYMGATPNDVFPANLPPSLSSLNPRGRNSFNGGPETPTPATYHSHLTHSHSLSNTSTILALTPPPHTTNFPHSHHFQLNAGSSSSPLVPQESQSQHTVTPQLSTPLSSPLAVDLPQQSQSPRPDTKSSSIGSSPSAGLHVSEPEIQVRLKEGSEGSNHPPISAHTTTTTNNNDDNSIPHPHSSNNSPIPSASSGGYMTSISRSPSPSPPPTAMPLAPKKQNGAAEHQGEGEVNLKEGLQASFSTLTIGNGNGHGKGHTRGNSDDSMEGVSSISFGSGIDVSCLPSGCVAAALERASEQKIEQAR
ncbi:unnamed protein product [Cyclocybe aegerita]|uniref:polynucleotide adenylyltransferase n=1 Tax=Cyclocybe aegerita TaxID=1973307 RepID=A0A8S0WYN5_CYCAE|nr:unnamed protein product [Cyclocybe aegerita]